MRAQSVRSPIRDHPLHNPGQSLEKEMQRIRDEFVTGWLLVTMFVTVLAAMEWIRLYRNAPPNPVPWTVFTVGLWAYTVYRRHRTHRRLDDLKQGRDGEKAVGQYLESLREMGAHVFHDVPARGFNVDHVIIAPQGIYAIETKTLSKPARGKAEIWVNGGNVSANGRQVGRKPVEQAVAVSQWLRNELQASTGRDFPVRPVLLFPGWYVHPVRGSNGTGAWVLNPKALPAFVKSEPNKLSPEDVKLATYHLSRYVRTFDS